MTRYLLIPAEEGLGLEEEAVIIPQEIIYEDSELHKAVKDKKRLRVLLKALSLKHITEAPDGGIMCKNVKCLDINFRAAVIDFCNSKFSKKYEEFYKLLRSVNIHL